MSIQEKLDLLAKLVGDAEKASYYLRQICSTLESHGYLYEVRSIEDSYHVLSDVLDRMRLKLY